MQTRAEARAEVVRMLGSKCAHCGEDNPLVLQINHKNNDGHELKRGGRIRGFERKHFRAIIRGDDPLDRYELLCANCHQIVTKKGQDASQSRG